MKKVAVIGSVGIPAKYGGFETLAEYFSKELSTEYDITVFCSSKEYPEKLKKHNGAKLEYVPLKANGIQSIPYDIISIYKAIRKNDTLLILGVAGCSFIPLFKLFFKKRFIVHIDGCEWKRDKWNSIAKWYLKMSEKKAMKHADVIIADNAEIQNYTQETYNVSSSLIEYGADHVDATKMDASTKNEYGINMNSYAFSVCRIEPENNIGLILEAFREEAKMDIYFVGNWLNSKYGMELYEKYESDTNIHLLHPIYDQNKLNQIRSNCHVYIHGHSAGGTNPSLVEAMRLGLNTIAFDVSYNRYTTEDHAAFFTDKNSLVEQLKNGLPENGKQLKKIANERYTWKNIAEKYSAIL